RFSDAAANRQQSLTEWQIGRWRTQADNRRTRRDHQFEASVAQVQTASAENSAVLTRDQFGMVPTKGRDLTNMLRLLPGVQMTGDQDAFGGATGFGATMGAVSGTRSADQNLTVDGIVANDLGAPAGLSGQLNMDPVQEVKVLLSNYQAEYGR